MPATCEISIQEDLVRVRIAGTSTMEEYSRQRSEIAEAVRASGTRRLLLDLQEAVFDISLMDLYSICSTAYDVYPPGTRVAAVIGPSTLAVDRIRFGEDVAANRGAALRAFHDEDAARRWLDAGGGASGP